MGVSWGTAERPWVAEMASWATWPGPNGNEDASTEATAEERPGRRTARVDARNGDVSPKRQKLLLYPKPPNLTRDGRRRESWTGCVSLVILEFYPEMAKLLFLPSRITDV